MNRPVSGVSELRATVECRVREMEVFSLCSQENAQRFILSVEKVVCGMERKKYRNILFVCFDLGMHVAAWSVKKSVRRE